MMTDKKGATLQPLTPGYSFSDRPMTDAQAEKLAELLAGQKNRRVYKINVLPNLHGQDKGITCASNVIGFLINRTQIYTRLSPEAMTKQQSRKIIDLMCNPDIAYYEKANAVKRLHWYTDGKRNAENCIAYLENELKNQ